MSVIPWMLVAALVAAPPTIVSNSDVEPVFDSGFLAEAKARFDQGDHAAAARISGRSHKPEARYLRALSLLRLKKHAEAVKVLEGLEGPLAPIADRIFWARAKALDGSDRRRAAAAIYGKIPSSSLLHTDALLARAYAFESLNERAAALEALEPLLSRAPVSETDPRGELAAEALLIAGRIRALSRAKADLGWARRAFIECWAGYPLAYAATGCMGRLKALPAPHNVPPDAEDLLRRAEGFLEGNHNRRAMALLQPVLKGLPPPGESQALACRAHMGMGKALRKERLHGLAMETLKPVVDRCIDEAVRSHALYHMAYSASVKDPTQGIALYRLMAADYPDSSLADDALYYAADLQATAGQKDDARRMLAQMVEAYPRGDFRDEARFRLAWLERQAGLLDRALETLERIEIDHRETGDAYEQQRALYWQARLLSGRGEIDRIRARDIWVGLYTTAPASYYGLLARSRLEELGFRVSDLDAVVGDVPAPAKGFRYQAGELADDDHFQAGLLLLRMGLLGPARDELNAVERERLVSPGGSATEALLLLAELLDRADDHRTAHNLIRTVGRAKLEKRPSADNLRLWHIAYPKAFRDEVERWAPQAKVPVDLLQALMREESALDPEALSPAGAIGLTQLMLPTARAVARKLKLGRPTQASLMKGPLNIRIGSSFLGELLRRFDGSPPLAIASYNAGPGAVRAWLRVRGHLALDEFVEEIPFAETRGYVKRVLRSYAAYRILYGKPQDRMVALSQKLPLLR
jgi:soluble lytic murein transglycosylase